MDLIADTFAPAASKKRPLPPPTAPIFDSKAFLQALQAQMTLADIMQSNRARALQAAAAGGQTCPEIRRMVPKKLVVARRGVAAAASCSGAPAGGAFGQEAYAEMHEVQVDDKVCLPDEDINSK